MSWQKVLVGWVLVGSAGLAAAQAGAKDKAGSPPVLNSGDTKIAVDTILSPGQEQMLLKDEDEILHFVSDKTQLPIRASVQCRFVSRESVAKDLRKRFDDDKDAKRMQNSELVLKKFGLLDADFKMKPFLLSLLTEQIAGYYDNKTRQMNLLDWVPIDEQKPVMAHELTHALQDQKVNLQKWDNQEIEGIAKNVKEDNRHIERDETDTAREAVLEGQAMVSFADYVLASQGHPNMTLKDVPRLAEELESNAGDMSDSPILARAPLVLQESLLFPYTAGLRFEDTVLVKNGTEAAFAGVLDAPPDSSYEILTPRAYLRHASIPLMKLPDIHPLLKDAGYDPYDVGVMGELDVRMIAELFGGKPLAQALAPEWDGGVYYAAQRKSSTKAEKGTTASLALMYSSQWKNADSARSFFEVFEQEMPRQYDSLKRMRSEEKSDDERVYSTNEGDVLLALEDKKVWVSEGFDLALARKLKEAVDAANPPAGEGPQMRAENFVPRRDLVGGLSADLQRFGVIKAALH